MTGEEIMHISRALSIMAEELSEVGLKGGEETVSDEVLDEAIEIVNSIRDACGEIEDHHTDRTIASDPDRDR